MSVEVLNDTAITFPTDVMVSVLNKNPDDWSHPFSGYDQTFPAGQPTIINTEAAMFYFAMDTRTPPGHVIKIRRDKLAGKIGTNNSHYDECLIRYNATTPEGRKWFENFEGRLVKKSNRMTRDEWDKLK